MFWTLLYGSLNKTDSEMMIVSTCTMTIDSSEFELNEEEREHQEQDTNPDYEITNSLALTVKTELTTHKKESIDQEKNETHLFIRQY